MKSIIVGFGKAGQKLHLPCLMKAFNTIPNELIYENIIIVDPNIQELSNGFESMKIPYYKSLTEIENVNPEKAVIHICTPPNTHIEVLKEVAILGYKNILVEKPLATSNEEISEINSLQNKYQLDIIVIANWLSSNLTLTIKEKMYSGKFGEPQYVEIEQNKPRYSRSLENHSHTNIFDIEIPHQIGLSCYLLGTNATVLSSDARDMLVDNEVLHNMGKASLLLKHEGEVISNLKSDLTSMIRKRSIKILFKDYKMIGYYPSGSDDSYSRLSIYDKDNNLVSSKTLYDDPLSACFVEYYKYFGNKTINKPISDLHFNQKLIQLLSEAKEMCTEKFNYLEKLNY